MASKEKESFDIVVALDIGTTYSGYAFQTTEEFNKNPLDIHYIQAWNAGKKRLVSHKTPTCLLLNKIQKVCAFGYEAETEFANRIAKNTHKNFYYFHRFKMKLCRREEITRNMTMKDVSGKPVRALDVFSLSIRSLIDHFLARVKVNLSRVRWVLTVPAGWSDVAKQFMAASAMMAGIQENQLIIALESEAAAIYSERSISTEKNKVSIDKDGAQFMMVDIGGGTTDITVLQRLSNKKMKQLCSSSGGNFGGMTVDEAYLDVLEEIVFAPVMRKLKAEHPKSYFELLSSFEYIKRSINSERFSGFSLNFPYDDINALCKSEIGQTFEQLLFSSKYSGKVTYWDGRLKISVGLLKHFFSIPIDKMIHLMKESFKKCEPERIPNILLVGGFSQCPILREAVTSSFPRKQIHFSSEPSLAVLKGAVIFGHEPSFITSRVVKYSYGIEVSKDFDPRLHSSDRRVIVDGEALCRGVFDPFVTAETSVTVGTAITETYTTTEKYQKAHYLPVYFSTSKNPRYTDDDECSYLGTISVPIENPTEKYRDVQVNIYFGFTALEIEAIDEETKQKCEVKFDLL